MPRKSGKKHSANQLRIIGGRWRGRKIGFPATEGLRPTADRIRETLFNWLGQSLTGVRALDLFAGSGALGFEALSRGAAAVIFVDPTAPVCDSIRTSISTLIDGEDDKHTVVYQQTAADFLHSAPKHSVDLLFVDPPFAEHMHDEVIRLIDQSNILAPDAMVYVESPIESRFVLPESWQEYRQKTTSSIRYQLIQT